MPKKKLEKKEEVEEEEVVEEESEEEPEEEPDKIYSQVEDLTERTIELEEMQNKLKLIVDQITSSLETHQSFIRKHNEKLQDLLNR